MRHMLAGKNLGLISARSNKSGDMDHFFVTDKIMETKCGERTTQSALFPLYLYPDLDKPDMFAPKKAPNIDPQVFDKLSATYGVEPTPEEILAYIYAVFYSSLYREKYAEFLRIDFPRVPFTAEHNLFRAMATLGQRLIDLHLLKSTELDKPVVKYQGQDKDNRIEKPRYITEESRVYINAEKYFEGISPEMWVYQIGGYKVLQKYLKDRKGRRMDDPRRYIYIATAIQKTIEIQREIDDLYPTVENEVL